MFGPYMTVVIQITKHILCHSPLLSIRSIYGFLGLLASDGLGLVNSYDRPTVYGAYVSLSPKEVRPPHEGLRAFMS
jgi:hypothetical protein